jgi:hypothetical protein
MLKPKAEAVAVAAAAVAVAAAAVAAAVAAVAAMPGAVALALALTPAAVEELPGRVQAQNLVAALGARSRRQTPQWMRLALSSSKTVIIWVFLARRSAVRASEPSSNGIGDNVRWTDRVRRTPPQASRTELHGRICGLMLG